QNVQSSSPLKTTLTGHATFSQTKPERDEIRVNHHVEMSGLFVGSMPARSWLDDYLQRSPYTETKKPPKLNFSNIAISQRGEKGSDNQKEKAMYEPFCRAVNESKACPGFTLVDVSQHVGGMDVDGRKLGPDLMLFANEYLGNSKMSKHFAWAHCEIFFEIKPYPENSGFCDDANKPLEKQKGKSLDTRAQLSDYAARILSVTVQQRCFIFVVEVCGKYVRLLRWNRAGCIVAAAFSFLKQPELLASFFH
ncbi:hypothetical protein K474DRAFT_1755665, partial [Panus rudis PR-1116 ss-1]